jgi:hypothetical protein
MPQRKSNKKKTTTTKSFTCASCGTLKEEKEFYTSYNPIHTTNRLPYCKICLKNMITDLNGEIDVEKLKNVLKLIDRPYIHSLWLSSIKDDKDSLGVYMKNLALNYKKDTWDNSKFSSEDNQIEVNKNLTNDIYITSEIIARWGNHPNKNDYQKLEQFYWDMKNRNKIETPQEEVYLKKLALISVKMDSELEQGNYDEAKKLGDLFSKYMADSQFRAIDKTEADKTGGIKNFGQIWEWAESDDFIPPWEYYRKLKNIKQDLVDKTIMHIENFTLKLNKIETMVEPPSDTPKISDDEIYIKED